MISSLLVFFAILSILVLAHEAGHFFAARKSGVWVEEFGFGLPPRLWGKKIGETLYSLNLFPFGGFVRLHGEDLEAKIKDPKRAFLNKSKKIRSLIILAGVTTNFILGILAFSLVYSFTGIPRETNQIRVLDVRPSSPAQVAGIIAGDIIQKVDKVSISSTDTFLDLVESKKGSKIGIELTREVGEKTETKNITLVPRADPPPNEGPLGVVISTTEIYWPPVWQRPFYGIYYGGKEAIFWGQSVVTGFTRMLQQLFLGQIPKDLAGPVGIFAISSQATKAGALAVINFFGILSINLAILNVMPFPALDGGRLGFIILEKIIGRRILPKIEAGIHMAGMILLLLLLLVITVGDINRLISAGSISGFIDQMLQSSK